MARLVPVDAVALSPFGFMRGTVVAQRELVDAHWDLRRVYRRILESRTYQQSSIAKGDDTITCQSSGCSDPFPLRARLDRALQTDPT